MENILPYDEKDILRRIADGDETAFRIFFDKYQNRFYAVVFKMTRSQTIAEEIVQEVFLKIWQDKASLIHIENADAYFFTAIYRKIFRHYKKTAMERKLLQMAADAPGFQNITDETILAQEAERLINEAVNKLPTQQQLVFKLSKVEGMSREQIALKLHLSPNTVRNHLGDAIKFIKSYLKHAAFAYYMLHGFHD